ncbi:MAG: ribonuclease III [Actinomycetota bacterium]
MPDARSSRPNSAAGRAAAQGQAAVPSGLERLGVPPSGGGLYDLALTHRSFAFEQSSPVPHNERLEFLGDSVLGVVVTGLIFDRYPELSEGEMARLRASVVNTGALAEVARSIGLGDYIRLGKGEEASGGRNKDSLLADTLEAVVGAVYLDRGIAAVEAALVPLFVGPLDTRVAAGSRYDAKTALQEIAVRDFGSFPSYRVEATGPDHDKRFEACVYLKDHLSGRGRGRSKKEAEQNAAREALAHLDGARRLDDLDRGSDAFAS